MYLSVLTPDVLRKGAQHYLKLSRQITSRLTHTPYSLSDQGISLISIIYIFAAGDTNERAYY
jgi:hypothetical protein